LIGLGSGKNDSHEISVLREMSELGAGIFTLAPEGGDISITTDLPEVLANVLYILPGQLLAFERSIARGLNPDEPHLLDAVVKL
jgi:glucosamine--fructose-6-phosphate aminotransferase (isomerizing)